MKQILFLASALVLISCGPKILTTSVKPVEIKALNYFKPYSYIQYIEKGNKMNFSDSLSIIASAKVDSLLVRNKSRFRLTGKIDLADEVLNRRVENEIGYMAHLITQRRKVEGIPLTPAIDSIMENNAQRFALATVATGFGRRKGNYGGQVAKGVAVGILTLGMVVPTPIKSSLTMHAFIFDSEKNEIAFYTRSVPVEKEPTNPKIIEKELISLFNGYFYETN